MKHLGFDAKKAMKVVFFTIFTKFLRITDKAPYGVLTILGIAKGRR
jgi:uncharacterized membrane protein (Fun14 family)